ncbi:MAG: hypothetical protein L0216_06445 [Planctomycetales bacterium]|nr:hypothetical protein [Planctomycetales bacterium]
MAARPRWVSAHQAADGSWRCCRFGELCSGTPPCGGVGESEIHTPTTTSLVLLALLGSGNSLRAGPYRESVKKGVKYLLTIQGRDGCVGAPDGDGRMPYEPALGALALVEAQALSRCEELRAPTERAVGFLVSAQRPDGGWRWGPHRGSDTLATTWAVLALKAAMISEVSVRAEVLARARAWLDSMTDPETGRVGYLARGDGARGLPIAAGSGPSEVTTAGALMARLFLGVPPEDPVVTRGVARLLAALPAWDPPSGRDFLYWYFGTNVCYQVGGDAWKAWCAAIRGTLVTHQIRGTGCAAGTFDPCDAWGAAGGRMYATAICYLQLQTHYRYGKIFPRR